MREFLNNTPVTWLLPALLLAGCASPVPRAISEAPPDNPALEAVRSDDTAYESRQVRWGGEILKTDNRESTTRLTVLARPLSKGGKPEYDTDDSAGRFIAIVPGFLDPQVYGDKRKITVTGTLLRNEAGKVGEFAYTYPVVQVQDYYLWPKEVVGPPPPLWYPWYYDPWYYDPWYFDRGYYGRPYYR
ncbi:MAG: Slp family lipoprotein [Thiogranum sp.]|jgi:outer membrane lipoprotein